jgi:hypothetical protein
MLLSNFVIAVPPSVSGAYSPSRSPKKINASGVPNLNKSGGLPFAFNITLFKPDGYVKNMLTSTL